MSQVQRVLTYIGAASLTMTALLAASLGPWTSPPHTHRHHGRHTNPPARPGTRTQDGTPVSWTSRTLKSAVEDKSSQGSGKKKWKNLWRKKGNVNSKNGTRDSEDNDKIPDKWQPKKTVGAHISVYQAEKLCKLLASWKKRPRKKRSPPPPPPLTGWNFSVSHTDSLGYIKATNLDCNLHYRSDHLPYQECADELMQAAVSSRHRRTTFSAAETHSLPGSPSSVNQTGDAAPAAKEESTPGVLWLVHVATCTHETNRLARAVASAGVPLAVVGLGTVWKWRWGLRMRMLHDTLVSLPEHTLVVFSDSADVIPVPGTTVPKILGRYQELVASYNGPRIFFAAEVACYPRDELAGRYPKPPEPKEGSKATTPFKYLNAGLFVGPAGLVRRMIGLVYQGECSDDQLMYSLAFLDPLMWWVDEATGKFVVKSKKQASKGVIPAAAKPLIGLDYWNVLLAAMFSSSAKEFAVREDGQSVEHLGTKGAPLLLHQNGVQKDTCLLELLSQSFGYYHNEDTLKRCNITTGQVDS